MIAPETRRSVWERDAGRCGFCGEPVAFEEMDVDHILPRSQGGTDERGNLRPSHRYCNRSSGLNSPYVRKRYVGTVQLTARFPPDLYERAGAAAGARGLNAWIVEAIAEKLRREGA